MTGASVPEGADAVVRMEDTRTEEAQVAVFAEAAQGQNIRCAGSDVRRGEKVIPRGEIIRPEEVGMLAAVGRSFILVHQRPLVAVVATGDELAEIDEAPAEGKIVSSNSYALAALVRECGAVPLQIGIARDSREDLNAKFRAAQRADLIISSGGVSAGDYDLVKEIMQEAGNRMHFWQVAMKPGRPLAFGALGSVPIVGLPGNPGSSMVCFEQFIRPAILKMLGHGNLFRMTIRARLGETIRKKEGFRHFIRAVISRDKDGYSVVTTGQRLGVLKSTVRANGLIVLPEEVTVVGPGELVTVQLLDDSLVAGAGFNAPPVSDFCDHFYPIPGIDCAFPDHNREDPLARHDAVANDIADFAGHMACLADLRHLELRFLSYFQPRADREFHDSDARCRYVFGEITGFQLDVRQSCLHLIDALLGQQADLSMPIAGVRIPFDPVIDDQPAGGDRMFPDPLHRADIYRYDFCHRPLFPPLLLISLIPFIVMPFSAALHIS